MSSQRDWAFTALTAIVLLELMASAVAALVFNRAGLMQVQCSRAMS